MKFNIPLLFCVLSFPTLALAELKVINKVPYNTEKKAERPGAAGASLGAAEALRFKRIFLFPTTDDVSGALAPALDERLAELFSESRFELIRDAAVLKALKSEEGAYQKVAQNPLIHQEAAKVTKADTTALLRTRNVGKETELTLEMRDALGEPLFSESITIPGASSIDRRKDAVTALYNSIIKKLPFIGAVTGRTANTVTLDLGIRGLKNSQELDIVKIVSLQRHPLLKTIIGTDYVKVGRVRVTNVDRALSFGEVLEEQPGEFIGVGNKILAGRSEAVLSSPKESAPTNEMPKSANAKVAQVEDPFEDRLEGDFDKPRARYGRVGLDLLYGSISQSQTVSSTTTEISGSGLGADFGGELWVTRNWLASLNYGFQNAGLSGAGTSNLDSSWKRFDFTGGYRFFPLSDGDSIAVFGHLGYQSQTYEVAENAPLAIGGKKYSGILFRVGGEIAVTPEQSVSVGFGLQPLSTFEQMGPSLGTPDGGTAIGFQVTWSYQFMELMSFRLSVKYDTASGNYSNSAATVSNKRFAVGPGIQYSF